MKEPDYKWIIVVVAVALMIWLAVLAINVIL